MIEYKIFDVFDIRKRVIKINIFCLDCGKLVIRKDAKRCGHCARIEDWRNPNDNRVKSLEIWSKTGTEAAAKLPRTKKQKEAVRKSWPKWNAEHPEEHAENCRKMANHPNTIAARPENGQKLVDWNVKNHNWISRPEALFYLTCLTKTFYPKDIVPQYYIKEIRHYADFAIPSQNLLFEVDGDYYHGHSGNVEKDKKAIARDAQIDKWAKQNGWTIFRYNDEKLRNLGIIK